MNWVTSDLHFGHEAIIKYCKRPFATVQEMDEALIQNWNRLVQPTDTIYILGDMTLAPYKYFEPIAKRLNGIKYLVKGNHDHFSDGQYRKLGFTVFEEIKMKLAGKTVRMSHYPYALPWYKRLFAYKSELRFMERRPPKIPGEWLLLGHSHVNYKKANDGQRIHVGVDGNNYCPISLKEIESLMNRPQK